MWFKLSFNLRRPNFKPKQKVIQLDDFKNLGRCKSKFCPQLLSTFTVDLAAFPRISKEWSQVRQVLRGSRGPSRCLTHQQTWVAATAYLIGCTRVVKIQGLAFETEMEAEVQVRFIPLPLEAIQFQLLQVQMAPESPLSTATEDIQTLILPSLSFPFLVLW